MFASLDIPEMLIIRAGTAQSSRSSLRHEGDENVHPLQKCVEAPLARGERRKILAMNNT